VEIKIVRRLPDNKTHTDQRDANNGNVNVILTNGKYNMMVIGYFILVSRLEKSRNFLT